MIIVVVAVAVVILLAGAAVWWFVLRGGQPSSSDAFKSKTTTQADTAPASGAPETANEAGAGPGTGAAVGVPGIAAAAPSVPSAAAPVITVSRAPGEYESWGIKPPSGIGEKLLPIRVAASTEMSNHPARDAFDGTHKTAWNENEKGPGRGEWIEATFNGPKTIKYIRMATGYSIVSVKYGDLFVKNAHVKSVKILFDGGNAIMREVPEGVREIDFRDLNQKATTVRVIASDVFEGQGWQDLCISELEVWGEGGSGGGGSRPMTSGGPDDGLNPGNLSSVVLDGEKASTHLNNGRKLEVAGDHMGAIYEYRLAAATKGDYAWAWGEMSYALNKLERFDYGIFAAQRAIDLGGEAKMLGACYFNLGFAHEKLGQTDQAIAAYEQSLVYRPGHEYVMKRLAALRGGE